MLINACIQLNYIPDAWKTAEVIMIPKPGKNLSEMESYRPISFLPIMSKLFEKLVLKRLKPIIADKHKVAIWTRKWQIKLNEFKSIYIDFTNNKIKQQPIFINGTKVQYANTAKYLGMTLDVVVVERAY
jgi:hypothetical protein